MYADLGPLSFQRQPQVSIDALGDDRLEYALVTNQKSNIKKDLEVPLESIL